jgi:hypothetical protein
VVLDLPGIAAKQRDGPYPDRSQTGNRDSQRLAHPG